MDKYKAVSNNMENIKSEKEQKKEATEKAVDVIGETALDAYTGGAFSKAKNMASNIPVFGKRADKTWNKAVKRVAKPLAKTPVGDLAKKANDSGITDKARQAKNIMNFSKGSTPKSGSSPSVTVSGNNVNNNVKKNVNNNRMNNNNNSQKNNNTNNNNNNNNNSSGGKNNGSGGLFGKNNKGLLGNLLNNSSGNSILSGKSLWKSLPLTLRIKIIVSCGSAFLLLLMMTAVFGNNDLKNLGLMNGANIQSSGASADLKAKLEEISNWYIENVHTYQVTQCGAGRGSGRRKYYDNPFISRAIGDDCTEFTGLYMSYVCGTELKESYSGEMVNINGSWAKDAEACGWKAYSTDDIGELQYGDVLIADNSVSYSQGGHGEVYIDSKQSFGWGSCHSVFPTNNAISKTTNGGHTVFKDSSHIYVTVYRYMNATSGSTGTVTDLGAKMINHATFNHGTKPKENQKYIMLHDTEADTSPENIISSWANSKDNGGTTAAHFVVGRDGTIVQAVELDVIAHHAGFGGPGDFDSKYGVGSNNKQGTGDDLKGQVTKGYEGYTSYGMNSYSIGIEMVHVGGQDYPEAQLNAVDKVIAYIDTYYGKQSTIIDHRDWRPTNSDTDPKFATYLANYKSTRHH